MANAASSSVSVRVLLFASYADRFGAESVEVTVGSPATVGAVLEHVRSLAGGSELPPHPLCARNLAHVSLEEPVSNGDEVALLPPLAGG
jgi:molybdopterin converting factor small subunit